MMIASSIPRQTENIHPPSPANQNDTVAYGDRASEENSRVKMNWLEALRKDDRVVVSLKFQILTVLKQLTRAYSTREFMFVKEPRSREELTFSTEDVESLPLHGTAFIPDMLFMHIYSVYINRYAVQ